MVSQSVKITSNQIYPALYCLSFTTWSQVGDLVNASNVDLNSIYLINIESKWPLVLTGDINIGKMFALVSSWPNFEITGVKGVDVVSGWPVVNEKNHKNNKSAPVKLPLIPVYLDFSTIAFYLNGEAPGKYPCTEEYILKNLTKSTFFNSFHSISFENYAVYHLAHQVCPFLFANALVHSMHIESLLDSFLVTNLFRFQQVNFSSSINSTITELNLDGHGYKLDKSLMHPLVYERVAIMLIEGSLAKIQPDLFKSFKCIHHIIFRVSSLTNFFHQVGVGGWASSLQNGDRSLWITFEENNLDLPEWLEPSGTYSYPNRDLCLFSGVPLGKVVPVLDTNLTTFPCTDTLAWLTKNYSIFISSKSGLLTDNAQQIYGTCWNGTFKPNMTDITIKISECLLRRSDVGNESQLKGEYKTFFDYYDAGLILQFANDLLEFIIIPFASILGLLLNKRVIWTVYKHKVELKEDFYKYMSLNAVFNCLFCIVYALYPINYCQRYETGYFCSTIYNTVAAQVIKIVFQAYFGEVFKMCSNISYIFITINRYMLVGKEHNPTLEIISKLNFKLVVFLTVSFSLLINIGHSFQYRIINMQSKVLSYHDVSLDIYPSIVSQNVAFQWYSIIYFVINFALFLVINTCVEVSLLYKLQKEIVDKRTKAEAEILLSRSRNTSESGVINKIIRWKQKKIEQDAKKNTRVIVMVLTNSCLNFILRFPEIFVFSFRGQ
jgi:hypothetical protein